jgi:hypothetical protein
MGAGPMSAPAAFRASYSDWKLIRTRKVVQIVLEVPVEEADAAYQVLGGMPNPGESVWCAVARLNSNQPVEIQPTEKPRREWRELSPAQQAGIRCADPAFYKFLYQLYPRRLGKRMGTPEDKASDLVRSLCGVQSRAHLTSDHPEALRLWEDLDRKFRAWMSAPAAGAA